MVRLQLYVRTKPYPRPSHNSLIPLCMHVQICVVVVGLAVALCSADPPLQNLNDTTQFCTPESNISLYSQLFRGAVTFSPVYVNFTSDQILENNILSRAQQLFNGLPKGKNMNFNVARDDAALNDVCRQMIGKLTPNRGFINNYNCPWEYKCDYDPHRIPQVLWQADCSVFNAWQCSCPNDLDSCSDCVPVQKSCVPVYYPVPVLYTSNCSPYDTSGDWTWQQIKIPVSCACSNENVFG